MPAGPGSRSSTTSPPGPSARLSSRRRTPTSFTSAAAKACIARISPPAMACTSRPTRAGRGRIWACATRSRSPTSPSIRATRTACSSRRSAIRTARTKSAASIAPPTAAARFQKVLSKDENTGGNDVDIDPSNPQIVYATMWEERQGPWENSVWAGTNGGIFKSTDGGTTWRPLTSGLPAVVQANLAISPANPKRPVRDGCRLRRSPAASGDRGAAGIYRSDDAGESWTRITTDTRPAGTHRRRRPADAHPASEGSGHR